MSCPMYRAIIGLVGGLLALGSCTQRMICPAYQSAFIYDGAALKKQFSYFKDDSTPKVITVSKDKYLIIPEASYRKKIRSMQTIAMTPVYTKIPDSLNLDKKKEFEGAETTEKDTTAGKKQEVVDSTYAITKDKEVRVLKYNWDSSKYYIQNITFNAEQDDYMWYFRDLLVLPDVRAAVEDQKNAKDAKANAGKKQKQGFFGFFKNLFKKKPKKNDTTSVAAPNTEANDSTAVAPAPPVKKKKGLFGLFGKKSADQVPAKKKDPAKKEEDGFE
jgi:hypothetical protein